MSDKTPSGFIKTFAVYRVKDEDIGNGAKKFAAEKTPTFIRARDVVAIGTAQLKKEKFKNAPTDAQSRVLMSTGSMFWLAESPQEIATMLEAV